MEGPLLTFECRKRCKPSVRHYHGARYGQPFSLEFPHFEVSFCNIDNNNKQTNIASAGLKAYDCVTQRKIVLCAENLFFQVYCHKNTLCLVTCTTDS